MNCRTLNHDHALYHMNTAPRFGSVKLAASKKVVFFVMVSVYCILFEQQNHPGKSYVNDYITSESIDS